MHLDSVGQYAIKSLAIYNIAPFFEHNIKFAGDINSLPPHLIVTLSSFSSSLEDEKLES